MKLLQILLIVVDSVNAKETCDDDVDDRYDVDNDKDDEFDG